MLVHSVRITIKSVELPVSNVKLRVESVKLAIACSIHCEQYTVCTVYSIQCVQ